MTLAIICYLATALIIGATFYGLRLFMKKFLTTKWNAAAFFGGMILSVVYFVGMVLLLGVTIGKSSNIQYYNTGSFKTLVGLGFMLLFGIARYLIIKLPFYNRHHESAGASFCFGLGMAPAAFIGIYCLIMTAGLAYNGIFNGPCVQSGDQLIFSNVTQITVFAPLEGHITFGLFSTAYGFFNLIFAWFIHKLTKDKYRVSISGTFGFILMLLDALMVLTVPFFGLYGLEHWQMPIIGAVCVAIGYALVRWMPKKQKKESYIKQFD